MAAFERIVLLRRDSAVPPRHPLPPDTRLVEYDASLAEAVFALDQAHRRWGDLDRVHRRFRHGLRFFALAGSDARPGQAEAHSGWTWVAAGVPRYIDELRWQVALGASQAWVRDAFVDPARRGHRLFAVLVEAIAQQLGGAGGGAAGGAVGGAVGGAELFSDVVAGNAASLAAHAGVGFEAFGRVPALTLGDRLAWRGLPPAGLPALSAVRPQQRGLWLTRAEAAAHRERIA
jgi:GNAT superfamily N-acetyltransferase